MDLNDKQKREICALILEKYGVQMDINNEFLPLYHLAYTSSIISQESIKNAARGISHIISDFEKKTASKVQKMETKKFVFQNHKESFWFAFGAYGLPVVLCIFLICSMFTTIWFLNKKEVDLEQNSMAVNSFFKNSEILTQKLDSRTTVHTIKLQSSANLKNSIAGKNYIFNPKCNCIEVPLFFKIESQVESK